MEVSTLGIVMPDGDVGAECDVCGNTVHALRVESGLELGGHEAVAISRVAEAGKVNGEHGHVKYDGDSDEAEDTR